jgi:hypothetical protein
MSDIILKEENVRKAHAQGCRDVKKVLETLCPEVFKSEYPCLKQYIDSSGKDNGMIVLFTSPKSGIVVKEIEGGLWSLGESRINFWSEHNYRPIKGIQEIPE